MIVTNICHGIPAQLSRELFDTLVENQGMRLERIVSRGQSSPEQGWFDQGRNEWVMVLQGAATLVFEEYGSIQLGAGDYIEIVAHCRHRVDWTDPAVDTIWLALHYE